MQKLLLQKVVSNLTIPKQTFIKKTLLASLFLGGFLLANDAQAQLSGPKAIPGDYATISAAVTALNTAGVGTGGVTFNIVAGHTETGTNLALTATGTAANPIIFQKSGTGANPKITSGAGASTTLDGIFKLSGSDYVTIDGIDLLDATGNTTATTRMEFGYALMRVSNTNGCQFVTIKNCNIQLNKAHNSSTSASIGIFSANHTVASTTIISGTGATAAGANSNNKFFSNTFSNIANGIRLEGLSGLFDENNEVGVGGGNTFSDFGSGTTAQYMIYSIYQDNYKVANNNINGGGGTGIIYGIYATTAVNANTEIFNNTVSISTAATTSAVYGIANASGGTGTNNLVKIYNNTVQNINQSASTTGVVYGIYNSATVFNLEIYNNTVSNITKTGTGDAFGINQTGVVVNNAKIFQNTITGITVGSTTAEVNGIQVDGGVNTVYNNFISGLTTTSATGENAVRGIAVNTGTNVALYYNTIYLNASSTSTTTFGTSGIYAVTPPNLDLRNNIIVNVSTPGATGGLTAAYRRSTAILATYNLTSNNNLFYAGTPGASRVIYTDGTNTDQTLTAYKNRVAPRDLLSVTELPPFVNVTTAPFNLHINPAVATQVESAGMPVSVTTDFDGNTRNATTPDLGADEGTFTPLKLIGPSVFYTALNNTVSTANRTITATITDRTGVATGALAPRIYYSKNGGTYFSQPGTAGANNTWTFTILASDLGTLAANDVISYYIVAQDIQATPVVSSFPVGVVATNVNTITTAPAIVSSYKITAAFGASINVGTGQTYTSLTNAGWSFRSAE